MGKNPEPRHEEAEFVFKQILRRMDDNEIREEMLSEELPIRNDRRYFHRMRRYLGAAKAAIEEQVKIEHAPLFMKKLQEHEELLISGSQGLKLPSLEPGLPKCYLWEKGEPSRVPIEHLTSKFNLPDTLEARSLRSHLTQEHPLSVGYWKCVAALKAYYEMCSEVYSYLLDTTREKARNLKILGGSGWRGPLVSIPREFVDTHYQLLEKLVGGVCQIAPGYRHDMRRLFFGGRPIADGLDIDFDRVEAEFGKVEALHREMQRELRQSSFFLVCQIVEIRTQCEELVSRHNEAIDIRVRQPDLLRGSCQICIAWGRI